MMKNKIISIICLVAFCVCGLGAFSQTDVPVTNIVKPIVAEASTKTKSKSKSKKKNYTTMRVKVTHYCPCRTCNGSSSGLGAMGRKLKPYKTIAVDKRVIPLGSKVVIKGKTYIAEDTGVRGKTIDICVKTHREAYRKGVYYTTVKVYKK